MSTDLSEQVRLGIQAAQQGKREQAKAILMQVVEQDQNNVQAWLWLSGVVDDLEDRQVCLENVLTLDPDNVAAQRGLAAVRTQRAQALLQQGITQAQAGQREQARQTLMQVVELDEKNVSAWLWLSGLVDDLEEHEVCLQNVLDLEPNHPAARKGLAQVQAELAQREQIVMSAPPPSSPPPPRSILEELDDPLLCPYCAAPTQLDDRRCNLCGGKLWVETGIEDKPRSTLLWILIVWQGLNILTTGMSFIGALSRIINPSDGVSRPQPLTIWSLGVSLIFATVLIIGLYQRWRWVYYLYLVGSIFNLVMVVLLFVLGILARSLLLSSFRAVTDQRTFDILTRFYLILVGALAFISVLWFLLILAVKGDFEGEQVRLMLDVSPRIKTPSALLQRGNELIKQKIWALAALHLARAIQPGQLDGRAALAYACAKIKRYDLAQSVLTEAQRISPQNRELAEIQNMLNDLRQKALS